MKTKRGRRDQSQKKKPVLCSMDCRKRARTVCAGCQRPLCKDHTILIPFGPKGDVLNLEICGRCSATKGLARQALAGEASKK